MSAPFFGYPGRVWSVVLFAANTVAQALGSTSNPITVTSLAKAALQTALNGLEAINANRIATYWQQEAAVLAAVQTLPITLSSTDSMYYTNRLAAITAAGPALAALVPQPPSAGIAALLSEGQPAISYPGLLEFFAGFAYGAVPTGFTDVLQLPIYAAQAAASFTEIAAQISGFQGSNKTYLYDIVYRFALEMAALSELILGLPATATTVSSVWNQLFVLPQFLMHADLLSGAPSTLPIQQDILIRYLIITIVQRLQLLLLQIASPIHLNQPVQQAIVMTGDSLMDIASRSLGDFEKWQNIANANSLLPPYIGGTSGPNVATWGSKLLLPVPGGVPLNEFAPNYLFNFLGVDIYVGPINGDMPPWTGDFQLIAGYDNLRWALGRRMQTTLGKLIYHSDYGSRIPPEVGKVQTNSTAGQIAAFGKACLLSDPRVGRVLAANAALLPNFAVEFEGVVQPAGFGGNPFRVNEVLGSTGR